MNAKEARKLSEENKYSSIKSEFNRIIEIVERFASQGETAVTLRDEYLQGAIVHKLEEEGHKVEAYDVQREGQWTNIFW